MATIAILNLPEAGHMNATYPLVRELVARGEKVVYYATEPFAQPIEKAGAQFRSLGPEETFKPGAHQGGLYSVMAYSLGVAEQLLPQLLQDLETDDPELLIIDSMCVWGQLAAQILKRPAISMCSVFATSEKLVSAEQLIQMAYGALPQETILKGIEALGQYMDIARRIDQRYRTLCPNIVQFFSNQQPLNIVFNSRTFHIMGDQFDESYHFVGPNVDQREDTCTPWTSCKEDAEDHRPLVYISLGTIFNNHPVFYQICLQALQETPCQVILNVGEKVSLLDLPPAPANFTLVTSAPQLQVLQKARLFITHGGINSTCEALWHQVPLIVFPQHGDQFLVARQVQDLGAGLVLYPQDLQADRLRQMVQEVLGHPKYAQGAAHIASSFKEAGGAKRAVDKIFAHKRTLGIYH